jgi:hypothetical protein
MVQGSHLEQGKIVDWSPIQVRDQDSIRREGYEAKGDREEMRTLKNI